MDRFGVDRFGGSRSEDRLRSGRHSVPIPGAPQPAPSAVAEGYQPLPLDLVAELDELPFDVYVRREERMVLYAVQGADPLAVLMRARHGLELYVPLRDVGAFRNELLTSLASSIGTDGRPVAERGRRARTFGAALLSPLFAPHSGIDRDALESAQAALDLLTSGTSLDPELRRAVLRHGNAESSSPERASADLGIDGLVYSVSLAQVVGPDALGGPRLDNIGRASGLRDVGLPRLRGIGSDRRPLDAAELATMRRHCALSVDLLTTALGRPPEYGRAIAEHHERADGSGFPAGARGPELSIEGRIVGLADALVAIVSPRPGKPAYPASEAIRILRFAMRGRFDDGLVMALVEMLGDGSLLTDVVGQGVSGAN